MAKAEWSVSGLCVTARPNDLAAVEKILNAQSGVEVHARDQTSGRLIAVQECASVRLHQEKLRQLQALPGVLTAELVLHYANPLQDTEEPTTGGRE